VHSNTCDINMLIVPEPVFPYYKRSFIFLFLCQTYTHIPKHLVRDNANMNIMFKQDDLNMHHLYRDHVNTDMSYN